MGPPSAGLTNHAIHGNAGGLTSHLTKNKGLGTPATAVMSTKLAIKWDRKLKNTVSRKDMRRATAQKFHKRLETPTLLSGATVTGSNKVKHLVENKKSKFEYRRNNQQRRTGLCMKVCFQYRRRRQQCAPTKGQCAQQA